MRKWLWILLAALIIVGIVSSAEFYTDWLWFKDVGYSSIFWQILSSKLAVGLVVALLTFLFVFANLLILRRVLQRYLQSSTFSEDNIRYFPSSQRYQEQLHHWLRSRWVTRGLVLVALVVAVVWALGSSTQWLNWRMYQQRTAFDLSDPIFEQDVSYYVFQLPFLTYAYKIFLSLLLVVLIGTLALYAISGLLSHSKAGGSAAIGHVSGLLALLLGWKAFGYKLDMDRLVYSPRGVAFGASYTDMHASLPIYRILLFLSLALAVGAIINVRLRRTRLTIVLPTALLLLSVLAGAVYPAFIERFSVEPNQLARETPYIAHNIEFTRKGFNLDQISEQQLPAPKPLQAETLAANRNTIDNIRLLDWRLLNETYAQLQGIRPYYRFGDIDIDRYQIDGKQQQIMLGVRELSLENMQSSARTWLNEHLVYTHGYGVVASPVTRVTRQGQPEFLLKDIPPRASAPELELTRPQIYFGELTDNYVIVNTTTEEFDYPQGSEANATTVYEGQQGIPLNFFNKLMFSLRFGTVKLFLSDSIQSDSRVLFNRNVLQRVQTIAPFLRYETDPYAVIADGRIFWIIDAYTESSYFPYSEPLAPGGANYVRNSVKVVVDAYNGNVTYYQVDEDDPIATTLGKIFPGLLQPLDEMPESLRAHLRYPESLLELQANVLGTYHMQNPTLFYNKEDLWRIALEKFENDVRPMAPYYTVMKLPGQDTTEEEFVLVLPITPAGTEENPKHNMIAWLAARNDGDKYGQLHLYHFPKDTVVQGPRQIDARIDQDTDISANLTLWSSAGSDVVRGNLLVVPLDDTILYVEPVYILASGNRLPELKRVIVATKDSLAMRPTLQEAIAAVLKQDPTTAIPTPGTEPIAGDASLQSISNQLNQTIQAAKQALQNNDWAAYGQQQARLEQLAKQLEQLLATPETP